LQRYLCRYAVTIIDVLLHLNRLIPAYQIQTISKTLTSSTGQSTTSPSNPIHQPPFRSISRRPRAELAYARTRITASAAATVDGSLAIVSRDASGKSGSAYSAPKPYRLGPSTGCRGQVAVWTCETDGRITRGSLGLSAVSGPGGNRGPIRGGLGPG